MNVYTIVLVVFSTLLCLIYVYYKHVHNYWKKHGVPFVPGRIPFGSITSVMLRKQSFTDKISEMYNTMKYKGYQYVGIYFFTRKALLIIDPGLVKKILSTDFQYFSDRGVYYDAKNDPLSAHLVALNGDEWKKLRQKLTPTFSSGKLKSMFDTVLKCAEQFTNVLNNETIDGEVVEIKDYAARYTTDVIGSCAFGIECNSLIDPNAEFRQIGKRILEPRFGDVFKRLIIRNAPWLAKKMKLKVINKDVTSFFLHIVKETIQYRKLNNVSRKDFLELLIGLMTHKSATTRDELNGRAKEENGLTINEVAAQCFVFFLAGFETSASTITFTLYELAIHTDIQEKLRKEIIQVLKKHDNLITYDAIMDMQYMEKVLLESMRKYPTFTMLMRKCTKDYTLPNGIIVEKGISVIIPVYALHHDSEYYPDPEQFNPDRFESEMMKSNDTYLPFGTGPRNCIGLRFAMIQMKVAITSLLFHFKFTLNEKTNVPLVMNPSNFIRTPLHGTWLNVDKLKNTV